MKRKLFRTLSLLAALISCWTFEAHAQGRPFDKEAKQALKEQTKPENRQYLVDVGARVIAPGLNKQVVFHKNRALVYVQFQEPIGGAERGELAQNQVRFYEAISPNTYVAKVNENALQALAQHAKLRGIEPVEAMDKITENLFAGTVPRHAV
ncbi:MAG TPA: hypothetical protein VJ063_21255, partial [Verrucomicrobiae bacterium]|nr:hypothetical protein [Verrucomicrobiae bacterium]